MEDPDLFFSNPSNSNECHTYQFKNDREGVLQNFALGTTVLHSSKGSIVERTFHRLIPLFLYRDSVLDSLLHKSKVYDEQHPIFIDHKIRLLYVSVDESLFVKAFQEVKHFQGETLDLFISLFDCGKLA